MTESGGRSARKDVKRAWLGIKMLISLGDCTQVEMKQLEITEKEFFDSLMQPCAEEACHEDVLQRRLTFESSDDMQEILRLFWFVVSQHRDTTTNEITKSGYIQYNLCIQRALIGHELDEYAANAMAEADYSSDKAAYGPLVQEAFYDVLLELMDTWGVKNSGPFFRSAFAWALFDCVVCHTSFPPRLKSLSAIRSIADTPEKDLLKKYGLGITARYRIGKWMDFLKNKHYSPQMHDRLTLRKGAVQLPHSMVDILAILGSQAVAKAKFLGAIAHDPNVHDIYKPKEDDDEKISLKRTVSHVMMLSKKKSMKLISEGDEQDTPLHNETEELAEPLRPASKFPVQSVVRNITKNRGGKTVLGLTIASKLLYKGESSRRQSILNNKTISVTSFLKSIRSLVSTGEDPFAVVEDETEDACEDVEELPAGGVEGEGEGELEVEREPAREQKKPEQVQASLFPLDMTDDTNELAGSPLPSPNYIGEHAVSVSVHRHGSAAGRTRRHSSVEKKRPLVVRQSSRDAWKYQLTEEYVSQDSHDSEKHPVLSTPTGFRVTLNKPKKRGGGDRHHHKHGSSDEGGDITLGEFLRKQEHEHERRDADELSLLSHSSSFSAASAHSLMERLQSPHPDHSNPSSVLDDKYSMEEHMKMMADQLTEMLGIFPVSRNDKSRVGHLYHRDGTARRVMSPQFTTSAPHSLPMSPVKAKPRRVSGKSTTRGEASTSALVSSAVPAGARGHTSPVSLPPLAMSPLQHSPIPGNRSSGRAMGGSARQGKFSRLSSMNDSDFDDDEVVDGAKSRAAGKKSSGKGKDQDITAPLDNAFLPEKTLNASYSWIKDMPRYLQETGQVKTATLAAMSKSCRLGNFVVDEPLELKDFSCTAGTTQLSSFYNSHQ